MIPKNELRTGCWVKTMSDSNPYLQIKYGEEIDYCAVYNEPIEITEELLSRCGFEERAVKGFYYLDIGNDTLLVSGGEAVWVEKIVKDEDLSVGLGGAESIHQLQNLYFTLCNKELDVELGTSGNNNR